MVTQTPKPFKGHIYSYLVDRMPACSRTFAIEGVSSFADSFIDTENSALRINICTEKPAHHKSANHWHPLKKQSTELS